MTVICSPLSFPVSVIADPTFAVDVFGAVLPPPLVFVLPLVPFVFTVWPPLAAMLIPMMITTRPPTAARVFRMMCRLRLRPGGGPGCCHCGCCCGSSWCWP